MNKTRLKVGLDIDDTVCDFMGPYLERFGSPQTNDEITKNVFQHLRKDKDFWINLEVINYPNFNVELFCTKRVNSKRWTREFLESHGLSKIDNKVIPIYQQYCQVGPKSTLVKGRIDVFIDDSLSNFKEMNSKGIPCLLMDTEHNRDWGPIGRVSSLDIREIEETYHLFKTTVFDNFNQL